jgi:adenylate cyclase
MAVFGVPFANAEDAIHACNSALKMRDAMIQGNRARLEHGKPALAMGIGINTGIVIFNSF